MSRLVGLPAQMLGFWNSHQNQHPSSNDIDYGEAYVGAEMSETHQNNEALDFGGLNYAIVEDVLTRLSPIIKGQRDYDLIQYVSSNRFVEPLDRFEIRVLAVGVLASIMSEEGVFGYREVLRSVDGVNNRPMSLATIYKIFGSLEERELLHNLGPAEDAETGRVSKRYKITDLGSSVFRVAVAGLKLLESGQNKDAA